MPRTEARLRAAGFGGDVFVARHGNFACLPELLAAEGLAAADVIFADLGVSSMQVDNPARGFSYQPGPLDMRMNPSHGEPASQLLERLQRSGARVAAHGQCRRTARRAHCRLLKQTPVTTTHALERVVRIGLNKALPDLEKAGVKMSVRRTFQAIRIAVNDEFAALDALLRSLPQCLSPGGRVAVLTFHSGEDRRVKKAFQAGARAGVFSEIATAVIRSTKDETFSNRRASAAKLRWAVRAT